LTLLDKLSNHDANHVALVSGRKRSDVERWFGGVRSLCLAAEHGAWVRPCNAGEWIERHPGRGKDWKKPVIELLEHFVARAPGSLIEEKENSVVWHYRMTHPEFGEWLSAELLGVLEGMLSETEVNAVRGQKCVEIRPLWVNKGQVVDEMLKEFPDSDFRFAVGDDRTDEDMFAKLDSEAWTVRVGKGDTGARFYLPNPASVRALLQAFAHADARKSLHFGVV
jgi:trehalose 6-phosphate synthase/phosphatase